MPLVDLERDRNPKGVEAPSKRPRDVGVAELDSAAEGGDVRGPDEPDPDPHVFYAKSTVTTSSSKRSRKSGRRSGRNHDTARETGSSTSSKRSKHHRRSNKKVGEETILDFHRENPSKAPLLASSSDEAEGDNVGTKAKNWIGVCNARLQQRVWIYSITFVLCFIVAVGVFLGFSLSYESRHGSRVSPLYPERMTDPASHRAGAGKSATGYAGSHENVVLQEGMVGRPGSESGGMMRRARRVEEMDGRGKRTVAWGGNESPTGYEQWTVPPPEKGDRKGPPESPVVVDDPDGDSEGGGGEKRIRDDAKVRTSERGENQKTSGSSRRRKPGRSRKMAPGDGE